MPHGWARDTLLRSCLWRCCSSCFWYAILLPDCDARATADWECSRSAEDQSRGSHRVLEALPAAQVTVGHAPPGVAPSVEDSVFYRQHPAVSSYLLQAQVYTRMQLKQPSDQVPALCWSLPAAWPTPTTSRNGGNLTGIFTRLGKVQGLLPIFKGGLKHRGGVRSSGLVPCYY